MLERVTIKDITTAIDDLADWFGFKEKVRLKRPLVLRKETDFVSTIEEIADKLGLPIRINLSSVSEQQTTGTSKENKFVSKSMVTTDEVGRGVGSITAQVSIPQNLPLYGTLELKDYPIMVKVSENCDEHPKTC